MTPQEVIAELTGMTGVENIETVYLHGSLKWVHADHYDFVLRKNGRSIDVKLLQSVTSYERDSDTTALIALPRAFAEAVELTDFILSEDEVATKQDHVAVFNTPRHLQPRKPVESIGGIRI
jgi:hypothetical protein